MAQSADILASVSPDWTANSARARAELTMRRWISTGRLREGRPLPPQARLASELNIARGTLRSVLQSLESEGLIRGDRHKTRLVAARPAQPDGVMARTIAMIANHGPLPAVDFPAGDMLALESAAMRLAREQGWHTLTLQADRFADDGLLDLIQHPPRGLMMAAAVADSPLGQEIALALHSRRIPLVVNSDDPRLSDIDRVCFDHDAGIRRLTQWAIDRGAKRIVQLWVGDRRRYWMPIGQRAFAQTVHAAGLEVIEPVFLDDSTPRTFADEKVFSHWMRDLAGVLAEHLIGPNRIDALMLPSDMLLNVAGEVCRLFNLEPQRDVILTGYGMKPDPQAFTGRQPTPAVATIDKRNTQAGQLMGELLMQRITGEAPAGPQRRVISPQLVTLAEADATGS